MEDTPVSGVRPCCTQYLLGGAAELGPDVGHDLGPRHGGVHHGGAHVVEVDGPERLAGRGRHYLAALLNQHLDLRTKRIACAAKPKPIKGYMRATRECPRSPTVDTPLPHAHFFLMKEKLETSNGELTFRHWSTDRSRVALKRTTTEVRPRYSMLRSTWRRRESVGWALIGRLAALIGRVAYLREAVVGDAGARPHEHGPQLQVRALEGPPACGARDALQPSITAILRLGLARD